MPADLRIEPDDPLPAGQLGRWLDEAGAAISGTRDSDVPCGTCTACCTSSQFVHIGPDEADALAHVPRELTFPAPGLPPGHVLLGYDERGHCPMLVEGACSIYDHRPRTCRTYDCRVFAATEVAPSEDQVEIRRRVARWRFDLPTDSDRGLLAAVRAAARFLESPPPELGEVHGVVLPTNPTQIAVLAIEIHSTFRAAAAGPAGSGEPQLERVATAIGQVTGQLDDAPPTSNRTGATAPREARTHGAGGEVIDPSGGSRTRPTEPPGA